MYISFGSIAMAKWWRQSAGSRTTRNNGARNRVIRVRKTKIGMSFCWMILQHEFRNIRHTVCLPKVWIEICILCEKCMALASGHFLKGSLHLARLFSFRKYFVAYFCIFFFLMELRIVFAFDCRWKLKRHSFWPSSSLPWRTHWANYKLFIHCSCNWSMPRHENKLFSFWRPQQLQLKIDLAKRCHKDFLCYQAEVCALTFCIVCITESPTGVPLQWAMAIARAVEGTRREKKREKYLLRYLSMIYIVPSERGGYADEIAVKKKTEKIAGNEYRRAWTWTYVAM